MLSYSKDKIKVVTPTAGRHVVVMKVLPSTAKNIYSTLELA